MNRLKGAQQYAKVNSTSAIESANPHQLIQMLYQGALDSLQGALGHIERKDFEAKGKSIGKAMSIIGGLQSVLDHEKGGEIAKNLDSLYDYISVRLYEASLDNDRAKVNEVIGLLKEIKAGWDGIAQEASKFLEEQVHPAQV